MLIRIVGAGFALVAPPFSLLAVLVLAMLIPAAQHIAIVAGIGLSLWLVGVIVVVMSLRAGLLVPKPATPTAKRGFEIASNPTRRRPTPPR